MLGSRAVLIKRADLGDKGIAGEHPDETVFVRRRSYPETKGPVSCRQQTGDGQHAALLRSNLDAIVQPVSGRNRSEGGRSMIEVSAAILALFSAAIFAAHALDAYRTG